MISELMLPPKSRKLAPLSPAPITSRPPSTDQMVTARRAARAALRTQCSWPDPITRPGCGDFLDQSWPSRLARGQPSAHTGRRRVTPPLMPGTRCASGSSPAWRWPAAGRDRVYLRHAPRRGCSARPPRPHAAGGPPTAGRSEHRPKARAATPYRRHDRMVRDARAGSRSCPSSCRCRISGSSVT